MKHCFVIDDSEVICRYARLIFEDLGYRVSESSCPTAALERMAYDLPDIVLLDWRIPGANMHEAIIRIRATCGADKPHIIYMPTENDYSDVQLALKVGANGYMLKPFNREIIRMKLHDVRVAA